MPLQKPASIASCIAFGSGRGWRVEVSENIQCPFCGQRFELVIDTTMSFQRFTTDCEVCCRPFEVVAECEPGEILSLDAVSG